MATISIASDKGGVSKTTSALLFASELALDGYRVGLIDADLNQQAVAFGNKADIDGLTVIGGVREDNILALLRKAEAENEVVIVDLPGGASTLTLKALHRSHFVLVPSQASLPDIRAAMKTCESALGFGADQRDKMLKSPVTPGSRACADSHLLLQVRCAVYNGTLGSGFGQKFHPANDPYPPTAIAA